MKQYLTTSKLSTKQLGEELAIFRRKAQEGGPYSRYWLKCADIAARLDAGKPVGNYRRGRRPSKGVCR